MPSGGYRSQEKGISTAPLGKHENSHNLLCEGLKNITRPENNL